MRPRLKVLPWDSGVGNPAKSFPGALWLHPKVPPSSLLSVLNFCSLAGTVSSPYLFLPFPLHWLPTPLQHFRRGERHRVGRRQAPSVLGTAGSALGCCFLKQILGHLVPAFYSYGMNSCCFGCIFIPFNWEVKEAVLGLSRS